MLVQVRCDECQAADIVRVIGVRDVVGPEVGVWKRRDDVLADLRGVEKPQLPTLVDDRLRARPSGGEGHGSESNRAGRVLGDQHGHRLPNDRDFVLSLARTTTLKLYMYSTTTVP